MELTTSWKEEGIEIGLQKGRQEGRQEGEGQLVLRLLKRRLGPLPADLEPRIAQLSIDLLEALAEACLDFSSLADLKNWLSAH